MHSYMDNDLSERDTSVIFFFASDFQLLKVGMQFCIRYLYKKKRKEDHSE